MPMLKAISGHTSVKGIRRYLTKKNRALAEDRICLLYTSDAADEL